MVFVLDILPVKLLDLNLLFGCFISIVLRPKDSVML